MFKRKNQQDENEKEREEPEITETENEEEKTEKTESANEAGEVNREQSVPVRREGNTSLGATVKPFWYNSVSERGVIERKVYSGEIITL